MTQPALRPPPMTTKSHPDPERLALHAAGQLRPVERVIVEAHLAFCATCVEQLRELLEPGARWLGEIAGRPVATRAWERIERRLDSLAGQADPRGAGFPEAGVPGALLPAAALEELGDAVATPQWRGVPTSRARFAMLATDAEADYDLLLVGLEGGRRFPTHLHLGNEEVVMLAGGYTDRYTHLDPGDYFHYAPGTEHGTLTDPDEPCWTLGLIEHGIQFRGILGAFQLLLDSTARARLRRYRRQQRSPGIA